MPTFKLVIQSWRRARPVASTLTLVSAFGAAFGVLPGACVFDPNHRCGDHQVVYGDNVRCVCAAGFVLSGTSCVPCGANEVAMNNACLCAPGYARTGATGPCEPKPSGLGVACNAGEPCLNPVYSHCQNASTGAGYCTNAGCTSSSECQGGYACDTTATPAFCRKPPTGAGQACTTNADCAGTEATYCDTWVQHACLVEKCTVTPNDCFAGTECCDLSALGVPQPICIPQGACQK